jgi:myo-inositol-1(or 4)-monophosphatase
MDSRDIDDAALLARMEEAAQAAAKLQLGEFRRRGPGWGEAKAESDFVSFVDVESEKTIRTILNECRPGAAFFGEETEQSLGTEETWVVDPLDGTTNYLSGFDHFSVSIALWDQRGPRLGVVLKPATGELFAARRGHGARRNGELLGTATALQLTGALIATGTPYRSPDTADSFFATMRGLLGRCRDIRRTGSAALDLCYLAAGFFQGFWEVDLQPYDVAAGLLMLSETGHPYGTFSGSAYDPFKHRGFVAGRPGTYEALQGMVGRTYASMGEAIR